MTTTKKQEAEDIAKYIEGMADGMHNEKLKRGSELLYKLSRNMCGQGYVGCHGGDACSSDHK